MKELSARRLVAAALVWMSLAVPTCAWAQTILVAPYVQPGDGRTLTGADVKTIVWLTDQTPGNFVVEFSGTPGVVRSAVPARVAFDFPAMKATKTATPAKKKPAEDPDEAKLPKVPLPKERDQHYFRYSAQLDGLPFNSEISYRVKLNDQIVRAASFRTRATADRPVRCVLVGDMAQGREGQKAVAFHIHERRPDFLMALGDIVYPSGRMNQYMAYFWDTYNNATPPSPKTGAPIMAAVPVYAVLGNHDIKDRWPEVPDALAAYYFFMPPRSGPGPGPWATPLGLDPSAAEKFRLAAADSYPNLDAYSFDNGPAHFVVMNNNKGVSLDSPIFQKWLLDDLLRSEARWKIACFHVPGFQSSKQHYVEQQARLLQPIFEQGGVDLTFSGHVHNYQRSVPLTFTPEGGRDKKGKVNGKFVLDTAFDGVNNTRPRGVIHVVAGGGGASLYGPGLDKTADYLRKEHGANYADFTAKMVADQHSFVELSLSPERLELRAFGAVGEQIDQIALTKRR